MPLSLYLGFVATCLVLMVMPGPNVALIVANSLAHGTRYGLMTGTSTAICETVSPDSKVLIVWLKRADGGDPGQIADKIVDASKGAGVYVVAGNGSHTNAFSAGLLAGRLFVAFTPRKSASGFKLYWPGNPPIALEK